MGVFPDELMIKRVPLHQQRTPSLEERKITIDLDRQMQVGKIGTLPDESTRRLRVAKVDQASFAQRVDGDDLGAAPLGDFQSRQHPGMVGAGILTRARSATWRCRHPAT